MRTSMVGMDSVWRHIRHGLLTRVAFWPVLCSILIMTVGGAFLWNRTGKMVIADRERVFGALADLAQQDLEERLERVAQDLALWSTRWGQVDMSKVSQEESGLPLNWAFSFRVDQQPLYELVLYVDRNKRVAFANSPHQPAAALKALTNQPIETLLGLPPDWLDQVLTPVKAAVRSPLPIAAINAHRGRSAPRTRDEVPLYYQAVFAVPVVGRAAGGNIKGAVVAVASWQVFQAELDRFRRYSSEIGLTSGYAFLIDTGTNRVIGHELRDPATDNLYESDLVKDHGLPELARALRDGPREAFRYSFRGVRKFAGLRRVTPPELFRDRLSWGLGVGVNEDEILQSVTQLTYLYAIVGVVATLAVFAAAILVGQNISMSLKELIRVARDASGGVATPHESEDEIVELQLVVNELAVRHRQSRAFVPLTNPYVVGNPIHNSAMFFGRKDDITWITDHLRQPGNELILLTGQRRIGKTSLLRHVKRLKNEMGLIPFFIDTQSLIPSVTDDQSFYRCLLEELQTQFPEAAPDLPEPNLPASDTSRDSIWKLLKYLNNARRDAIPVILIDELENFELKFKSRTLTPDVLSFMAALLDSTRTVSIIATGSDRLERRRARYWNALLVKSVRRHLGVLSNRDARSMIVDPLAGKVMYADEVPDAILRLTGCHPYYTQDVCQRLVNEINQRQTHAVDGDVLAEVVVQVLMNPPPTLDYFWTKGIRVQARVFLSLLASALPEADARAGVQDVIDLASPALRTQLVSSKSRLATTIEELVSGDWLDAEGGRIRFKADLLRLWLQREHPPTTVEIEVRYPPVRELEYDV